MTRGKKLAMLKYLCGVLKDLVSFFTQIKMRTFANMGAKWINDYTSKFYETVCNVFNTKCKKARVKCAEASTLRVKFSIVLLILDTETPEENSNILKHIFHRTATERNAQAK